MAHALLVPCSVGETRQTPEGDELRRSGMSSEPAEACSEAIAEIARWRRLGARLLNSLGQAQGERDGLRTALAAMEEQEQHFRGLAYHDELTGLPNQRLFDDRLSLAIAHSSREKSRLAVLYLDLDGFKAVNDSLGHSLGDRVLVELADRIRSSVRGEDTVARLGGDEFAVLLPQVTGAADAGRVVDKVLDAVRIPFRFDGSEVAIRASVGVGLFPDDGDSAGALVRSADAAMYRAKQRRPELEDATPSAAS
jgi:diguanylate cyclase (GGDEF)-like protein